MIDDIAGVSERLVEEFTDLPPITVMQAVCSCSEECDEASPLFVEQAARALLRTTCGVHGVEVVRGDAVT
jgi:hypothetical protein